MKRSHFNIITAILAVVYIGMLILGNVIYTAIPVATVPGSYAEKFAKDNMLHQINVPDSEKKFFDFRYENFDYNTTDQDTLSIENYSGKSKDLMIPGFINGKMVTAIGEHFFDNLDIDSIYLPETIVEILAEPNDKITVYCKKDCPFYSLNKDSEDWKIETVYDSEFYNPLCADIPFMYNDNGSSIELVEYTGDDKNIVIPSHIDGKPVTTVSFNLLGRYDMVVFPDTVNEITGKVSAWVFSRVLVVEVLFTIIAFVLVIIAVNVVLPRYSKSIREYMLSGPQMIVSIAYLIIQIYLSFRYIYLRPISAGMAFIISFILLIAYLTFVFAMNRGREHSIKVTEKVAEETSSIRNLQSISRGLTDGIKDPETKKAVSRVVDEIRYTQAKSKDKEIELIVMDELYNLKDLINGENKEGIIGKCNEIINLMKNR